MNIEERESRLKAHVAAMTIARGRWTDADDEGRATACLLAAWSPEVASAKSGAACPAEAMPAWLAWCTIDIDDRGSEGLWWPRVERYAAVIRRVVELPPKRLKSLDYEFRAVALREARTHAGSSIGVVDRVLALCERAAAGKRVTKAEWAAAAEAAKAAAKAAAWAAKAAARAGAAKAAAWAEKAAWAAEAAGAASASASWASASWASASVAGAASWAAAEAAWDRILDGWLTAMEGAV